MKIHDTILISCRKGNFSCVIALSTTDQENDGQVEESPAHSFLLLATLPASKIGRPASVGM